MKMDRLIIATDIDGTLTDRNYILNLEAVDILRKLSKRGAIVVLVSSHAYAAVSTLGEYLGFRYVVGETGACGGFPWRPLFVEEIPSMDEIVSLLVNNGFKVAESNRFRLADISLWPIDNDVNASRQLLELILKDFNVDIFYSGFAFHIVKRGVNKGRGLLRLLEKTGISGRIIAIGDGENDVPLFSVADFSIAPADAPDILKRTATVVTCYDGFISTLFVLKNIEKLFKFRKFNLEILKKLLEK